MQDADPAADNHMIIVRATFSLVAGATIAITLPFTFTFESSDTTMMNIKEFQSEIETPQKGDYPRLQPVPEPQLEPSGPAKFHRKTRRLGENICELCREGLDGFFPGDLTKPEVRTPTLFACPCFPSSFIAFFVVEGSRFLKLPLATWTCINRNYWLRIHF